jgi:hypothetical protein
MLKKIRPLDWALAAVFTAWGVVLMIQNIRGTWAGHLPHERVTTTAAMLPFFLAITVPILWRRANILGVVMVTATATALHVFLFSYQTRCQVLVPLSVALAYAVGRFAKGRGMHLNSLAGVFLLQVVMLVRDSSIENLIVSLPLTVPVAALFYGIGYLVQTKVSKRQQAAVPVAA